MNFLDRPTLNLDDPQANEILEILIRAYADQYEALAIAGQVGILQADIAIYPKMRYTWWSILEEAARTNNMRRLVSIVLQDPTSAGYHNSILEVLQIADATLLITAQAPVQAAPATDNSEKPVVGSHAPLWPLGHTIKIRFLDGKPAQHEKVVKAATPWLDYANLYFDFGDHADAEVRVSFKQPGSWSYVGAQALDVRDPHPTINFGWITPTTEEKEVQRVVLHEFGHVLGLMHEHGNPLSNLAWDKEAVYATYSAPPNNWTRELIDRTIFEIWPPGYFPLRKVFDPMSIMIFPIAAEHLRSGAGIGWNYDLSPLDKQFVAALYPLRSHQP